MAKRWTQRPDGSTWGDWGDDDELGRVNLMTPAKVLEGVAEVEAGISFCLSLPLDFPGGTQGSSTLKWARAVAMGSVWVVCQAVIATLATRRPWRQTWH